MVQSTSTATKLDFSELCCITWCLIHVTASCFSMGIIIFHWEIGFCTTLPLTPSSTTTPRFYNISYNHDRYKDEYGGRGERALAAPFFFSPRKSKCSHRQIIGSVRGRRAKGYKPRVRLAITRVCSTNPETSESEVECIQGAATVNYSMHGLCLQ